MKMRKFSFLGIFAVALMFLASACSDPCKDVVCVNGECVEGDCVCDTGYEGTDCGTAINAKFAGTYNLTETCSPSGAAGPYAVTVTASSTDPSTITFTGLWEEAQATATATVSGSTNFTIEKATFSTGGWEIDGSGSINTSNSQITISYNIYTTGSTTALDACTGTMDLQ